MARRIGSGIRSIWAMGCWLVLCSSANMRIQTRVRPPDRKASSGNSSTEAKERANAWRLLEEAAKDGDAEKRANVIRALGLLGAEPQAVELAESGLVDKEPEVRASAARVLGEMGSAGSVPKLVLATRDRKISVALAAAHSLLALRNNAGYEVYYAVMTGKRKSRNMIDQQLDELKDPKNATEFAFEQGIGFVPYAGAAFEAIEMLTKKDPSPIRAAAAVALANDPDPRTGAVLVQAVKDKNWLVRVAALRAIAMRGAHDSLDTVEEATLDPKEEVRFAAAVTVLSLTEIHAPRTAFVPHQDDKPAPPAGAVR